MATFPSTFLNLSDAALRLISDRPETGGNGAAQMPSETAYPVDKWNAQKAKYQEYVDHFEGEWLDETIEVSDDKSVEKYPLKFNVYKLPAMLHASFLFGQVPDSSDPLVTPVVEVSGYEKTEDAMGQEVRKPSQKSIDDGKRMTEYLNKVWYDSDGRVLQLEAGLVNQIYGGNIFGTAYDPSNTVDWKMPFRVEHLLPDYFFPVWAPNDKNNLVEAIVTYRISSIQAQALFGVEVDDDMATYQERWARDHYEITVNDTTVSYNGQPMQGAPLGGFVPYTYIPHPPRVGGFYGESLLKNKLGLAAEINSRLTDVGDVISQEARQIPAVANAQDLVVRTVSGQMKVLSLGRTLPGKDKPEISWPSKSVSTSTSSVDYVLNLLTTARNEAYTPPIVYGLDEGSQRSALTLALRMIPLISHIRDERTYWETGLSQVEYQLLVYAALKGEQGITMDMVRRAKIHHDWAPMMPRDAEQELNQILMRLQAETLSPQTAMKKLGDIQDIEGEMNLIRHWLEYKAELGKTGDDLPEGGAMGEKAANSSDSSAQADNEQDS